MRTSAGMSYGEMAFLTIMAAAILGTATMCGYMSGKEEMRPYKVIKMDNGRMAYEAGK